MTTTNISQKRQEKITKTRVASGVTAATLISSGIGILFLGLMTTGAVISEGLKNALNWWNPAGPLTGKTGIAVIVWLVSWVLLNTIWKDKEIDFRRSFTITMVLIGLGILLTFPPVFEAFE